MFFAIPGGLKRKESGPLDQEQNLSGKKIRTALKRRKKILVTYIKKGRYKNQGPLEDQGRG